MHRPKVSQRPPGTDAIAPRHGRSRWTGKAQRAQAVDHRGQNSAKISFQSLDHLPRDDRIVPKASIQMAFRAQRQPLNRGRPNKTTKVQAARKSGDLLSPGELRRVGCPEERNLSSVGSQTFGYAVPPCSRFGTGVRQSERVSRQVSCSKRAGLPTYKTTFASPI